MPCSIPVVAYDTMETVNYDILMLLSQLLAQSEDFGGVASMTRTCRFLHMECASLLLTPRHIGLPGEGPIESFCRFMLADKRRRYPLLSKCHSLGFITFVPLPEPISDLLAETLRCVTTFPGCVRFIGFERLMLSSRRILPALAALTWIHRLDINSRGSEMIPGKRFYAKFLKALQAPLNAVKVSVPFSGEKHYHVSYDRELDPLWLFSSLSSTLESIVLIGDVMVEACSMTPVYPRLTHLTVSKDCMPVVRPYIKAFPSLRVLHFNYAHFTWADTFLPRHSLPTATLRNKASEELRRDNRADQLAHGSWTGMKYFMAMTLDAYMAGLTCQIPSLHLIAWGGTSEGEISAICAVVADARPSLFRLALRPPHIGYIPALFSQRSDLFKSLSSLELRVDLTTVPFDLKSYFVRMSISARCEAFSLREPCHCIFAMRRTRLGPHFKSSV